MEQKINNLMTITNQLKRKNIKYALGGSGLLYALGLVNYVNDWDITTDEFKKDIIGALSLFKIEEITSGKFPFASDYKLTFIENNQEIEIIGNFSIHSSLGICNIPSVITSEWRGIAIGSAESWYVAYKLMNREEKANLLYNFLKENGADNNIINILLNQPLPIDIKDTLTKLTT
ncbi:hypothetical protein AB1282_14830 [Gottfriedia sp. S16(2024)]|uniref:hypothetical protein n=1 Tax=Gottfriedia sp. S16(2024) TaxID=3162883 RepID=UPI003D1DCEF9